MKREILIVDDERIIRAGLRNVLEEAGYLVSEAANGRIALEKVRSRRPSLVLLDVMMPGMNGRDVCAAIRRFDKTLPVVFLTALDTPGDEVLALKAGGDDFVSKETGCEILLARIEAALRRAGDGDRSGAFMFAGWVVDSQGLFMTREGDAAKTPLTERETAVLRAFSEHPDEVFSRDYLLRMVCDGQEEASDDVLTMFFVRLRSKLGEDASYIKTIRGSGYIYRA